MNKRNVVVGGALGLVVVVLGMAWWLGFFSDSPEAVTLDAAVAAVGDDAGETTSTEAAASASDESTTVEDAPGIDGEWTVQANADATFVGYRINEVLSTIGDFEVVGRTADVAGTLAIDGTTITDVSVVAQMGSLTTDSSLRDGAMRRQALETAQFPDAMFTLTSSIELESVPADSEPIQTTAMGDLTIHGVTQAVDFPLEAQIVGDSIVVVGQLPVLLADYDISLPTAPIVASVEDNAVLELSLVLTR